MTEPVEYLLITVPLDTAVRFPDLRGMWLNRALADDVGPLSKGYKREWHELTRAEKNIREQIRGAQRNMDYYEGGPSGRSFVATEEQWGQLLMLVNIGAATMKEIGKL